MPLESSLGVGYVWLNREKAERRDMSGLGVEMFGLGPDISGDQNRTVQFAKSDTPVLTGMRIKMNLEKT
jgi:hypothetical protein